MAAMASQTTGISFVHGLVKESIKAPRHWPLWGELDGHRLHIADGVYGIPLTASDDPLLLTYRFLSDVS